ncbi:MAG: FecR family protein [Bacteroidales bacterium]|nr:FecR family protein [Bacteroidales bacterium]
MEEKIILRYILGTADKNERRQVASWIQESPENVNTFARIKAQYVFSGMPNSIIPEKKRILPVLTYVAAALSIPLLVLGICLYCGMRKANDSCASANRQVEILTSQNPGSVTYVANPGVKSTIVLPDSSIVKLNGDSKLIAPNMFAADSRRLFLSGEGYFEVKHHEDWPMLIQTAKDVSIKVLGTTFDLKAYENEPMVKLTLIEGKVLVRDNKTNCEHEVMPHQEFKIQDSQDTGYPEIRDADIQKNTSWTKGELVFDNTPMTEIAKQLERWYGVKVHIADNKILNYRLTARFTNESIVRVLDLIHFSSMVNYEIRGNDVYISNTR